MSRQISATGVRLYEFPTTDWRGLELSDERKAELEREQAGRPKCRHCGEPINREMGEARADEQTTEQVMGLLGNATFVVSSGGPIAVACWLEHQAWALRYVRYERRNTPSGPALYEMEYPGERVRAGMAFGIWPLLAREYAV
jgi:hypothetical protein